jgi:hypothetical protein
MAFGKGGWIVIDIGYVNGQSDGGSVLAVCSQNSELVVAQNFSIYF